MNSVKLAPNGNTSSVTIEDVDESEGGRDEGEFAPGGDADYFAEEDEDGRFLCVHARPPTVWSIGEING